MKRTHKRTPAAGVRARLLARLLYCAALAAQTLAAPAALAQGTAPPTKAPQPATPQPAPTAAQMLQPADIFEGFPALAWGISFQDARKAIEKTGASPVGFKKLETELAWDGTFNGMQGRASARFREDGGGLSELVVGVYAFAKQKEVFEAWLRRMTERHGAPRESSDDESVVSKVWRLPNGFAVELRSLKDENSPVVDIHWVAEAGPAPRKRVTVDDLAKLRWLEGYWRGTGDVEKPFYERYYFDGQTTLVVEGFEDETLAKSTGATRFALNDGQFGNSGDGARWAAAEIDDTSVLFEPVAKARNSFRWRRGSPDAWTAILDWPADGAKPARRRTYTMERIKR